MTIPSSAFISINPFLTNTKTSIIKSLPYHSTTKCVINTNHSINPNVSTLSRRTFSFLLATTPILPLFNTNPAYADNLQGLVTPYKDLPKGFTILRPNGWNEFEGLQDNYDIKWQDVIQPLEFVTVLTSPVAPEKSLNDLGPAQAVGDKLASARGGKLVQALEKEVEGIPMYLLEIKKPASHQLTLLSINKQKLYSVNASCSEKRWSRREKLLRGVVESFRPKL